MLTLARFMAEKFGGDTIDDVRAGLDRLPGTDRDGARRARRRRAPTRRACGGRAAESQSHGLTGTDEAGSGGDD